MSERISLQGRLSELKEKLKSLEYRADNHVTTIRNQINPYDDFADLPVDNAYHAMKSLQVIVREARDIKEQIKKLEEELGKR